MLEYESTIADAAEPGIRLHLRTKTFLKDRMASALWSGLITLGITVLVLLLINDDNSYWKMILTALCAALLGGWLGFVSFKDVIKTRIGKYLEREHGSLFPMKSKCDIKDGRFCVINDLTEVSFALSALSGVTNDGERLELIFGDRGICVLPLRAFSTIEEKAEFLKKMKGEHQKYLAINGDVDDYNDLDDLYRETICEPEKVFFGSKNAPQKLVWIVIGLLITLTVCITWFVITINV